MPCRIHPHSLSGKPDLINTPSQINPNIPSLMHSSTRKVLVLEFNKTRLAGKTPQGRSVSLVLPSFRGENYSGRSQLSLLAQGAYVLARGGGHISANSGEHRSVLYDPKETP